MTDISKTPTSWKILLHVTSNSNYRFSMNTLLMWCQLKIVLNVCKPSRSMGWCNGVWNGALTVAQFCSEDVLSSDQQLLAQVSSLRRTVRQQL